MVLQDMLRRTLCALVECLVGVASGHVHHYFAKSVPEICSVNMEFSLEKCVLAEFSTSESSFQKKIVKN